MNVTSKPQVFLTAGFRIDNALYTAHKCLGAADFILVFVAFFIIRAPVLRHSDL